MFWGLLAAVLAALFAHTRGGLFLFGFTDPKIICITAGIVAAWYWKDGRNRSPELYRATIAYGVSLIPSLVSTKYWATALFGHPGLYSGGILATGLCGSGVLLADRLTDDQKSTMRRTILASVACLAVLCVAQVMGRDPLRWPLPGGGAPGIHGSVIDTGTLMVVAFSVSHNPLFLMGSWATHSRAAWLGMAVAAFPSRFRVWAFVAATVIGMTYSLSSARASDQERSAIWRVAVQKASWFGSGPATFSKINNTAAKGYVTANAHNSILEAAATRGIFGVIGLLALLVAPEMAGVWTIAMLNPISFEVIFISCVLVGLRRDKGDRLCAGLS